MPGAKIKHRIAINYKTLGLLSQYCYNCKIVCKQLYFHVGMKIFENGADLVLCVVNQLNGIKGTIVSIKKIDQRHYFFHDIHNFS